MSDNIVSSIVTIATAITGIAVLAVLVSGQAQTSNVIMSATQGFANDIQSAVSSQAAWAWDMVGGGMGMGGFTGGAGTMSYPM
ncbi:MAG: hypothetical protein ACP5EP_12285 [Acidobacteriaceae bacterium]